MLRLGGGRPRDLLLVLEESQLNHTVQAFWDRDFAKQALHQEAADAYEWVIDLMDKESLH